MKMKMYLHGSKESNLDKGEAFGLRGEALQNFMYALYEVAFDVDVDATTGNVTIEKVNGRKLARVS